MSDDLVPHVHEAEIVDHEVAGSVRVLTLRNPFAMTREERFIPEGRTLAEILADLDLPDWQSAMVAIDGRPVKQEWWATTRPSCACSQRAPRPRSPTTRTEGDGLTTTRRRVLEPEIVARQAAGRRRKAFRSARSPLFK
jgi:sulfur carrier protein ThiS